MSADEDVDMADASESSDDESQLMEDTRKDAPVAPSYKVKTVLVNVRQKLGLALDSKSQVVNYVEPGGYGAQLGIEVGNQMMTLNGEPFGPTWDKWKTDDSLKPTDLVSVEIRYQTHHDGKNQSEDEGKEDDEGQADRKEQAQADEDEEEAVAVALSTLATYVATSAEDEQLDGDEQPPAEEQPQPAARMPKLMFVSSSSDSEDGVSAVASRGKKESVQLYESSSVEKETEAGESAKESAARPAADVAPDKMEEDDDKSQKRQSGIGNEHSEQNESQLGYLSPAPPANENSDAAAMKADTGSAKPRSQWSPSERKADLERRHREDGCVAPASMPKHLADGTFRRPSGPSPRGKVWDEVRGLWAPQHAPPQRSGERKEEATSAVPEPTERIGLQLGDLSPAPPSNKESDAVTMNSDTSSCTKAKPTSHWSSSEQKADLARRQREDGCIVPASVPQELPDGTFRRPLGASPKGTVWDEVRGLWAPQHASPQRSGKPVREQKEEATSAVPKASKRIELQLGELSPAPPSNEESDAVIMNSDTSSGTKIKPRSQWSSSERKADLERRQREDGCIAPASVPQQLPDGTFRRPGGIALKGMTWDEVRGLWAPRAPQKSGIGQKPASSQPNLKPDREQEEETTSVVLESKPRSKWTSADRNADLERRRNEREDGCLPPASTPEKFPDGTFRCPYGVRPKGFSWDNIRGLWVPKKDPGAEDGGQMLQGDSENDSKRPANEKAVSDNAKENEITVGTRVYCKWTDQLWYWGRVIRVYRKRYSHFDCYEVEFDDGDQLEDISRRNMYTVAQAEECGSFPPEASGKSGSKRKASNDSQSGAASSSSKKRRTGGVSTEQTPEKFPGYDPHKLFRKKCGKCQLCTKDDCGKCSSCRWNGDKPSSQDTKCCLQKMCDVLPEVKKAQPSFHLPKGWLFVFSSDIAKDQQYAKDHPEAKAGLRIVALNGRRYRSLEAAASHNPKAFEEFSVERKLTVEGLCRGFYEELGLAIRKPARKAVPTNGVLNPRELKRSSCGTCAMCTRENCGKCAPCRSNHSIGRQKECCFQKMCQLIPDEHKAQAMPKLPNGWKFIFDNTFQQDMRQLAKAPDAKPGLRILAPNGVRYKSLEAAMNHNHKIAEALQDELGMSREDLCRDFYELVGIDTKKSSSHARSASTITSSSTIPELKDALLGKPICQQWIDADGFTKIVYGQVTEHHPAKKAQNHGEQDEEEMFTIEYNEANTMQHDFNLPLPASRKWDSRLTLGAVLSYETKAKRDVLDHRAIQGKPRCIWMVPDMRRERLYDSPDGRQRLPNLTMEFRGYKLELNVKKSTIENAGNGVFLSCVPLDSAQHGTPLVLQEGEYLDLGVYAPHRPEDRKLRSVFLVKNFVFEEDCVVWVFESLEKDYHLDITDDHTGELHDVAKLHVPVYVNESSEDTDTVRAEHDPSGAVHYLLGCSSSQFVIPSDGTEQEVFIWYGAPYEPVRIKRGYSKLPPHEQERVLEDFVQGSDEDFVHAVLQFNWKDLVACSLHLLDVFTWKPDHAYMTAKVKRALLAAVLLQRRARQLFEAETEGFHPDSQVQKARHTIAKLVKRLLASTLGADNTKRQEWRSLLAQSDYEELEEEVLEDGGLLRAAEEGPSDDEDGHEETK